MLLGQLIAVQKFDWAIQLRDKLFPFVAHAEGGMRERAQVAGIGLGRNDLVADIEQRVYQSAVGSVDENESGLIHQSRDMHVGIRWELNFNVLSHFWNIRRVVATHYIRVVTQVRDCAFNVADMLC